MLTAIVRSVELTWLSPEMSPWREQSEAAVFCKRIPSLEDNVIMEIEEPVRVL